MRIKFINPNFTSARSGDAMEPLAFAILAGLTPPDVEKVLNDECVEAVKLDEPADLVALSVKTFTAKRAYAIAAYYHERGTPVVMGGIHPTLYPEESAIHADSVVIGDCESVWPRVVEDARAGKLCRLYRGDPHYSLANLVFDRSIFRGKRYLPVRPIQFGRGCRFACDFCCVHTYYGGIFRQRPVDEVVEEIASLGSRNFIFVDDNLLLSSDSTKELLKRIALLRIRWACELSVDAAFDTELLELMERSGCVAAYLGLESLNPGNLAQMGKAKSLRRDYTEAISRFKNHGVMVCGSFLFGYDEDTRETIENACAFSIRNKLCLSHFNIAFPAPGTRLYERLLAEKRILFDRWWINDDFRYGECYFRPMKMGVDELKRTIIEVRRQFNSCASIFRRAFDRRANSRNIWNFIFYWIANLINRREVYRKEGLRFG